MTNGGTLNVGGTATLNGGGTFTGRGRTGTLKIGALSTLKLGGTISGTGGTFTAGTGTVEYTSANPTIASLVYQNLIFSGTGAAECSWATYNPGKSYQYRRRHFKFRREQCDT